MKNLKVVFLLSLFLIPNARALEVGALGGLNFFNPSLTLPAGTTATSATSGVLSGGLFFKKGFNPLLDVEVDLIYMKKKTTLAVTSPAVSSTTVEMTSYMVPVIFRTSFVPGGFVNVGAGAYYEVGSTISQDGVSSTYANQGLKNHDLGLVGSAQLRLPLAPLVHVLADARYLMGLTEQSTDVASNGSTKNRSLQVYAGLSVGF
jgi:hypothetical protein